MRTLAESERAQAALDFIVELQRGFAAGLERVQKALDPARAAPFETVEWLRDGGRHGGGERQVAPAGGIFDRGSINVSQVHYDDLPEKKLASATALSTIIHPAHPRSPSVHIHLSWTELRDGMGYWRIMADLNPSIPVDADREAFAEALKQAAPGQYAEAAREGDRYFYIPALQRHRGVTHFYLESFASGDWAADATLARRVGTAAIDRYLEILERAGRRPEEPEDRDAQLEYHTLYLFQVLTLDRGTTSGLLVHDQNDVGILGSLPSHVSGARLAEWAERVPSPQDRLVRQLVEVLGSGPRVPVDESQKRALAQAVRAHYRAHPDALSQQASASVVPPTVQNHA
jgi:coproporphyrinogen III oxidase